MNERFDKFKQLVHGRRATANRLRAASGERAINEHFAYDESCVQERMMRIGIEARELQPQNNDELYEIAVLTLIDDQARRAT